MWGVVDDSAEEPWHELWGLFRPDGDVSWQHKALCAQTDPEAVSYTHLTLPTKLEV